MSGTLFVSPRWVGDLVMSIPMMRILNQRYGEVDCIIPKYLEPLFYRMGIKGKTHVLDIAAGEFGWGKRKKLAKEIKLLQKDISIVLQGSYKSALLPWMANIPRRVGFLGELRYGLLNDIRKPSDKEVKSSYIHSYTSLALEKNEDPNDFDLIPRLQIDLALQKKALEKNNLLNSFNKGNKRLIICPGSANNKTKRWKADHILQLARTAFASGWDIWMVGGKVDIECIESIVEHMPFVNNLVGKTSIIEAVDLIGCADIVIANDSGLMHIASALNKPIVAIYGSTHPDWAPPQSDHHAIMYLGLECQPCVQKVCPLGHHHCMTKILPTTVFEHIEELYQRAYSAS